MADDGGISDNAIVSEVRHEPTGNGGGWTSLGHAIGGGLGGANTIAGETAYQSGMRVGAQTADALAQARDRVQKSDSADAAAKALESPELQAQLKLTPELGNYFATQARMGKNPEEVTQMMLQNQQYQMRARIADTSQPLDQRHAAAFAEAPASMASKAEGPLGSVFDPGANGGSGQTTVGGPQMAFTNSEIQKNKATGEAATALATQRENNPNGPPGAGKLQTGFMWDVDKDMNSPTYGQVQTGPDGQPRQVPNPTAGTGEGAYGKLFHENMLGSLQGATTELKNLIDLGPQESVGLSNVKGSKGLLGALSTDMGRALSTTQQQMVHKSLSNLGRFVATVENGGRSPTGGMTNALQDTLESLPTDTQYARPYGLALARQNLEAQESRVLNGTSSPDIKKAFVETLGELRKTVPFTPQDVRDWSRSNQPVTIGDWIKNKSGAGGSSDLPPGFKVVN